MTVDPSGRIRQMQDEPKMSVWRDRPFFVLLAIGIVLRFANLLLLSNDTLDPDAGNYMFLAGRFSWTNFWAAGYGEPLWIGLLKAATAPFGYAPIAARTFTTVASVALLPIVWRLFTLVLSRRAALIAFAFVSLNGLLIFIAPRALREELVMLCVVIYALAFVNWKLGRWHSTWLGIPIAIVSIVRFEIAPLLILATAIAVVFTRARRELAVGVLTGILGISVLAGPWLVSNASDLGDPFHHSSWSATWFRNQELGLKTLDEPEIDWVDYYTDFVGPPEALRRFAVGLPSLIGSTFYNSINPIRATRLAELVPKEVGNALVLLLRVIASLFTIVCVLLCLVALAKRTPWVGWALGMAILATAPYAALSQFLTVNYRLIAFSLPFWAVVFARGIEVAASRTGSRRT